MKRYIYAFMIIASVVLFLSCDDQVDPKTNFQEIYILNCVLRGDTTHQILTLARSYQVEGYDPYENNIDPSIYGAEIKLTYNNKTYTFRDTVVSRQDQSRYTTPLHYYYLNNFKPTENKPVKVEAKLQNGKVLTATSETFAINFIYFEGTMLTFPPYAYSKPTIKFSWAKLSNPTSDATLYFAPELVLFYTREENGVKYKLQKKVPMYYLNSSTENIAIYPPVTANESVVSFDTLAISKALKEISDGDPDKQKYTIEKAVFRLLLLDKNLAVYYAAQKTFLDEFSIRFSRPEFTNVEGGIGIFGTYAIKQESFPMLQQYVHRFGYKALGD